MDEIREIVQVVPVVHVVVQGLREDEREPSVGEYNVSAVIKGAYARVSTTFTLVNPNVRVLEGELEFPLPDGAVVCGYAIDINGIMVDGRVVEKEKARIAFENEVKKGIDPGLVEHVRGNLYRTRIYPIPSNGSRRICVEYVTPLCLGANGDAALFLPMPQHELEKRDVRVDVQMPGVKPPSIGGLGDRRFEAAEAFWHVESHESHVKPEDHILIGIPLAQSDFHVVEEHDGFLYYLFSAFSQRADHAAAHGDMPKMWRILWDASGSRKQANLEKMLQLISLLPEDARYELTIFRNDSEPVKVFEKRSILVDFLSHVDYDGGTNLAILNALVSQEFEGMTLLFSDGFDTFEGKLPSFGASSVAIVCGVKRDAAALKSMCGGRLIDLDLLSAQDALDSIVKPSPVLSVVKTKTGDELLDIVGIGQPAVGRVMVLGRSKSKIDQIEMTFSDGSRVVMPLGDTPQKGKTLATAWAASRIEELSANADDNREILLSLGRHFSIVSPVSSMIVFERLEQWLEYDIEPPESLAEIHEQWIKKHKSAAQIAADEERAKQEWLGKITHEWEERVKWWENPVPKRVFPKSGVFADEDREEPHGAMGRLGAAMSAVSNMAERVFSAASEAVGMRMSARRDDVACSGHRAPMMMRSARGRAADDGMVCDEEVCRCCAREAAAEPESDVCDSCSPNANASVTIQAWDPNTPYLIALKDAKNLFKDDISLYHEYIKQRDKYHASPAFYLDCAGFFFKENKNDIAIRILSNLSELKLEDTSLLRVYAWRLREAGELDGAIQLLRKIIKLRPDEAVSWRDLALTLTMRARRDKNAKDVTEALECFKKAAFDPWKRRDALWTSLVALEEFNALAAWSAKQSWDDEAPVIPELDVKFRKNLDTDVRIVLMWDADNTDIDLHVLEPSGEEVFYSHKLSQTGGMISFDVTTGYGPEEFLHKKAPKGTYQIMTNYFASHQQKMTGPVTVTVTVFTNWARDNETSQILSLRLEKAKDKVKVGSIEVN